MKKFKDGAAFIITEADYTSHPNIGHDSKFVSNVESIEQIVREAKSKFKVKSDNKKEIEIATEKTIGYIEDKLGLEKGRLGNNLNEICIIYLKPEQIRNPRIPDGNASGTNRFWIPGGCTASENAIGIPEIVIDCSHLPNTMFNYDEFKNLIPINLFH